MRKKNCENYFHMKNIHNQLFVIRVRAVEVPCVLNIAAVKLKFKEYDEAIYECNKVLEIEVRYCILSYCRLHKLFGFAFVCKVL